ncbi:glycosyltransferase family 9 protein [Hippea maritima]|uniref:glycosyltransferase family 9 protein n=1 Tax=Hippea maritima TaxID=84405 RepID=UPI000308B725|nr:glycosyltransferase family 9 protein [Hippea maritima]
MIKSLSNCSKITIVPKDIPIDVYAALIDFCDVFVTSDTGTMHIAAARKFSESGGQLRNKTAVFSIFGATSARMYGYDSYNSHFLNPGQDAPSKLYISNAVCRNLTCVNKKAKKCKKIRCFEGINEFEVAKDIINYLSKEQ